MSEKTNHLAAMRHSCAHVMADAVMQLFPGTKLAIGPAIDNGFYYDFDLPRSITPDDLPAIEERMRAIIAADYPFIRREVSANEAYQQFADQPYKLELIEGIVSGREGEHGEEPAGPAEAISTYTHGTFTDLCRGPHVARTGQIGPFKLLNIAGAYWRGDEHNKMLTRIYGTCFPTKEELDQYLWTLEEAKKRDHRKLGKELGLFIISEEVGQGLPLWLPKGARIRKLIEDFVYQEQVRRGYQHVYTPHIGDKNLWVTSGHWDLYHEKMFAPMTIDEKPYLIKPMNCPMHMQIYKHTLHSYRDLPVRIAEIATVYRREQSGELTGMLRVRMITQDDAHIFVRPDQIKDEFLFVLDQALYQFKVFGFEDFEMWLSVRDPKNTAKYLGSDAEWQNAEQAIEAALVAAGHTFIRAEGEAKFYGPALDIMVRDALGRKWQMTTIQVDFMLPQRFKLEYIDADGQAKPPVVLHRAPLGSMERFVAVLTEHYAGAFPLWLAPIQVMLIPIADRHVPYATEVKAKLEAVGLRVEVDARSERMNLKIRDAQLQKIPYMLVVGDKEVATGTVSVRLRTEENLGPMPLASFIERATRLVASKATRDL
jgi:threonyl-tRNA synthetase